MQKIAFHNKDITFTLKQKKKLRKWLLAILDDFSAAPETINYIFCNDKFLLSINKQFLAHDYYTDVITFDYTVANTISGDIFISIDTVRDNAKSYGDTFQNELHRVMAHGMLHLCGQKDKSKSQRQQMTSLEDKYLKTLCDF